MAKVNIKSEKSLLSEEFITQASLFYALSLGKIVNGTPPMKTWYTNLRQAMCSDFRQCVQIQYQPKTFFFR